MTLEIDLNVYYYVFEVDCHLAGMKIVVFKQTQGFNYCFGPIRG
jgi:hypothetical protein